MLGEPEHIAVADGDVWVSRYTGPAGDRRRIQLEASTFEGPAGLSLDDAARVALALLAARDTWLRER